jgi:hypothetical protein
MKQVLILLVAALAGCSTINDMVAGSGGPELYDGKRHVVIYCDQADQHIYYLRNELIKNKSPEFVSDTKNLIWNIKFSCG